MCLKRIQSSAYMILLLGCLLSADKVNGQLKDICENKVPDNWLANGGKLSIDSKHHKTGKQSVRWDWDSKSPFFQMIDTAFKSFAKQPRSTFVLWIYNEKPIADHLTFQFSKNDQNASSFTFNLNFRGWRTAWVMYNRDMTGMPVEGMNGLKIISPPSVKTGSLYFDQVMYNMEINPRSPMRDEQVPFVNVNSDKAANAHWTALYAFSSIPNYLPLGAVGKTDIAEIAEITSRFKGIIYSKSKEKLADLERDFAAYSITRKAGTISGKAIYSLNDVELINNGLNPDVKNNFKKQAEEPYSELMNRIANFYLQTDLEPTKKLRLEQMFIDLLDHLDDQGWSAGSGMGALHHLGYNFRDFYTACLLMKPVIKQHHLLARTQKTMAWFSGLGRTRVQPKNIEYANIDVFNTLLGSMLSSILMLDNSPSKLRQLHEYSNWLSKSIMPNYAIEGTFKPDGAVFHHGTLYPAYAIGGFQGITPIVYTLSNTVFQVKEEAHTSLQKMLLTMSYYTNPIKWPISISGRHPTGAWKVPEEIYAYMALSGSPDHKKKIDTAMAGVYLKIVTDPTDKWASIFRNARLAPTPYRQGHWNLNYGLLDIHRRADWLLTIKGHNRYIVSHESYPGANVFGRYAGYGQLEVSFPQTQLVSGSNFKDEGWDWNNLPGTTTLYVPIEKLRANIINADDFSGVEEMLLSDEIFAGGTNLNHLQGLFSMKLHGHDKYGMGSFRAIKSWFMFDDLVVCLGSDIHNTIRDYSTQTTIFQNVLDQTNDSFQIGKLKNATFPFEQKWNNSKNLTIIDNRGIGYYIPQQKDVEFTLKEQLSRDQKDSRNTKGNVAKLIINHGNAPLNGAYQYAMLITANTRKMSDFEDKMSGNLPVYQILQQDSLMHAVWYRSKNTTALSIFQASKKLHDSLLIAANKPCLVMYEKVSQLINLSVTDPDLAFYTGADDSPLNADGTRKEVSIYSRSWYTSPAKPSFLNITVKGLWQSISENVKVLRLSNGTTKLTISCKYGIATQIQLKRSE